MGRKTGLFHARTAAADGDGLHWICPGQSSRRIVWRRRIDESRGRARCPFGPSGGGVFPVQSLHLGAGQRDVLQPGRRGGGSGRTAGTARHGGVSTRDIEPRVASHTGSIPETCCGRTIGAGRMEASKPDPLEVSIAGGVGDATSRYSAGGRADRSGAGSGVVSSLKEHILLAAPNEEAWPARVQISREPVSISSTLYPSGSSTNAITVLPPLTGPGSRVTLPPAARIRSQVPATSSTPSAMCP